MGRDDTLHLVLFLLLALHILDQFEDFLQLLRLLLDVRRQDRKQVLVVPMAMVRKEVLLIKPPELLLDGLADQIDFC